MNMDILEIIGLCAGACTTFSVIPQLRKIFATKSTKDLSYLMYFLNCTGFILWITYGYLKDSSSLMIANTVTLLLSISVILLKYKWDNA